MALKVGFRPQAEADLFGLYRCIAEESGLAVAGGTIDRIEAACLGLADFPRRGTRRDDPVPAVAGPSDRGYKSNRSVPVSRPVSRVSRPTSSRKPVLGPGLRTIGFDRRATIVFRVTRTEVIIVRIFYGGQDFERVLRGGTR